jgi:hypothetical protein
MFLINNTPAKQAFCLLFLALAFTLPLKADNKDLGKISPCPSLFARLIDWWENLDSEEYGSEAYYVRLYLKTPSKLRRNYVKSAETSRGAQVEKAIKLFDKYILPFSPQPKLTRLPDGIPSMLQPGFEKLFAIMHDPRRFFIRLIELETAVLEKERATGKPREMCLNEILYETEKKHGFSEFKKIKGRVKPDAFHSLLNSGTPFNDEEFKGAEHGKYVHRIQWWVIMHEFEKERHSPALVSPLQLYRAFGEKDFNSNLQWVGLKTVENPPSLWQQMFDVPSDPKPQNPKTPKPQNPKTPVRLTIRMCA